MPKSAYSSSQVRTATTLVDTFWEFVAYFQRLGCKVELLKEAVRREAYKAECGESNVDRVSAAKKRLVEHMAEYESEFVAQKAKMRMQIAKAESGATINGGEYLMVVIERVSAALDELPSPFDDVSGVDQLAARRAAKTPEAETAQAVPEAK